MRRDSALKKALAFLLGLSQPSRDRSSPLAIVRLVVIAGIFYALFMSSEALMHRYGNWFRAFNGVFLSPFWFWPEARADALDLNSPTLREEVLSRLDQRVAKALPARFQPPGPEEEKDTLLLLQNSKTLGQIGFQRTGSRLMGYTPTALLIALILATPIPWRRRLVTLIAGLVVVHAFVVLRMTLMVASRGFADVNEKFRLFTPSTLWTQVLNGAREVFCDNPTFHYVIPVVLWGFLLVIVGSLSTFYEQRRRRLADGDGAGSGKRF